MSFVEIGIVVTVGFDKTGVSVKTLTLQVLDTLSISIPNPMEAPETNMKVLQQHKNCVLCHFHCHCIASRKMSKYTKTLESGV